MQYRSTHPSGFALGICASILHTNLGSWSITITYKTLYTYTHVSIVTHEKIYTYLNALRIQLWCCVQAVEETSILIHLHTERKGWRCALIRNTTYFTLLYAVLLTSETMSCKNLNGGLLSNLSVSGGFLITFPSVSRVLCRTAEST